MSMFDSDDDDRPVYDSQLNTLPGKSSTTFPSSIFLN